MGDTYVDASFENIDEALRKRGVDSAKASEELEKNKVKAEEILKDKEKTHKILKSARNLCAKASYKLRNIPVVGSVLEDTAVACDMIADYMDGKYKDVPLASIVTIMAAIIYFVSPIDLIPDTIPIFGQLDDTAVLLFAFKAIGNDIQTYGEWKVDQLEYEESSENLDVE